MHVWIEGTTPGVEWGKEPSLSVEEWSSPESRSPRADADGPRPVTCTRTISGSYAISWLEYRQVYLMPKL